MRESANAAVGDQQPSCKRAVTGYKRSVASCKHAVASCKRSVASCKHAVASCKHAVAMRRATGTRGALLVVPWGASALHSADASA
jgi:uncharacterized protein YegP (UPF0339 family)